jgi:hypothetical protein
VHYSYEPSWLNSVVNYTGRFQFYHVIGNQFAHAVAADLTCRSIHFFDPNLGELSFEGYSCYLSFLTEILFPMNSYVGGRAVSTIRVQEFS